MITKFNRFAIVPIQCFSCKKFVIFEPYRHADIWENKFNVYITGNICKDCIYKFK